MKYGFFLFAIGSVVFFVSPPTHAADASVKTQLTLMKDTYDMRECNEYLTPACPPPQKDYQDAGGVTTISYLKPGKVTVVASRPGSARPETYTFVFGNDKAADERAKTFASRFDGHDHKSHHFQILLRSGEWISTDGSVIVDNVDPGAVLAREIFVQDLDQKKTMTAEEFTTVHKLWLVGELLEGGNAQAGGQTY